MGWSSIIFQNLQVGEGSFQLESYSPDPIPTPTHSWYFTGVWEFLFSADFLFFENFLLSKFQLFLLFSAYFWHFTLISRCFSSFFACSIATLPTPSHPPQHTPDILFKTLSIHTLQKLFWFLLQNIFRSSFRKMKRASVCSSWNLDLSSMWESFQFNFANKA